MDVQPRLRVEAQVRATPARPDKNVTRCTCGSWAFLYGRCPGCGADEVTAVYLRGI